MHRGNLVAELEISEVNGIITSLSKVVDKELLPLGVREEKDLIRWWNRRAVPLSQGNIKRALQVLDIPNSQELLLKNMGLSLIDHYWIRPATMQISWEQINLFQNHFKDVIGEFQFNGDIDTIDFRDATEFTPSASAQGELKKKWIVGEDGHRYLIKGNYGLSNQQSINEVIATEIHRRQNRFSYTTYKMAELSLHDAEGMGCICECFADEKHEFIPAYDIVSSEKKRNDVSNYEAFIQICGKNGLDEEQVRSFLEYQILTDFVITNTDRHFNNFGVLRNTDTLKFEKMAPIFDSGNSMFWNVRKIPVTDEELLNIKVVSFKSKETELLKYIKGTDIVQLEKLPGKEYIRKMFEQDEMDSKRITDILNAYEKKIYFADRIQKHEKLPVFVTQKRKLI